MWEENLVKIVIEGFDDVPATTLYIDASQVSLVFNNQVSSLTVPLDSWMADQYRGVMSQKLSGWIGVIIGEYEHGHLSYTASLHCIISEIKYENGCFWITFTETN